MTEIIPMRSVLMTDFGEYEVPGSVTEKIERYPKQRFVSDESGEELEWQPMTHPTLARYYRIVSNHMKAIWLQD